MCVCRAGRNLVLMALALVVRPAPARPHAPPAPDGVRPFKLMVGDPAPPLAIERWLKGAPVERFQPGRIYVVELWATWCGPCVAGIPRLSALQRRYAADGVTVVGVTAADEFGNSLESVARFLERRGVQVGYSIGWDDQRGTDHAYQGVFRGRTMEAYLEAAQVRSIPCSFVVDRAGRIASIGHPLALDDVVASVVAGTWDLEAEARRYRLAREAEPLLDAFQALLKEGSGQEASALGRRLVAGPMAGDWRGLLIVADAIAGTESTVVRPDLPLALEAALRANELTRYGDPGLVGLLAQVHFRRGELEPAIELAGRAVSLAEGGMQAALQKRLQEYERARGRSRARRP